MANQLGIDEVDVHPGRGVPHWILWAFSFYIYYPRIRQPVQHGQVGHGAQAAQACIPHLRGWPRHLPARSLPSRAQAVATTAHLFSVFVTLSCLRLAPVGGDRGVRFRGSSRDASRTASCTWLCQASEVSAHHPQVSNTYSLIN
jgi:hypothetical protein